MNGGQRLRDNLLEVGGDALDTPTSTDSKNGCAEQDLRELRDMGGYFRTGSSSERAASCCHRIDCKNALCCCISKAKYYRIRRFTYDTLSRNASKFGRRTHYLPSRIFELYSVTLVLANVLFSIWIVQSDTEFVNDIASMIFDSVSTCCFTAEFMLRLWACIEYSHKFGKKRNKCGTRFKWFWKPLSFFDFLCLCPLYFALYGYIFNGGYEMWVALVRVFIFLRLERQAKALGRLRQVLGSKAEELMAAVFFAVVCILYCAVAIYYLEMAFVDETIYVNQFATFGDAVWWAVATITSVGYGDIVPHSWEGQIFASFVAFLGVATLAIPSGIIGATFVEVMANQYRDRASSVATTASHASLGTRDNVSAPSGRSRRGTEVSTASHFKEGSHPDLLDRLRGTFGPVISSHGRTFGPVTPIPKSRSVSNVPAYDAFHGRGANSMQQRHLTSANHSPTSPLDETKLERPESNCRTPVDFVAVQIEGGSSNDGPANSIRGDNVSAEIAQLRQEVRLLTQLLLKQNKNSQQSTANDQLATSISEV